MVKIRIDIKDAFKGKDKLTKDEITKYIRSIVANASDDSIRQRISRYKKSGLIVNVKKSVYALSEKPIYQHPEDLFINKLSKIFSSKYSKINYCVWSSAWLYDFTIHQPTQFFYIFETESDMVETAFNLLRDNEFKAFLNPDEQSIQLYVMGQKKPVIVKQLITRSPIVKTKKTKCPSIEKMLVDAYTDKKQFYFIQGEEIKNIFKFSFDRYSINISTLLSYAERRGNKNEISDFVNNIITNHNIL